MKYLFISIFMFGNLLAIGQQIDDPGFPGGDPDVPVDGGLVVLLGAAAVYGLRKINLKQ
ncbi:PID-CTERM protein-sorting domain-containing protein [Pedobacter nyackensis]|uniref:PID-CTERM protein-sorting domain-containing protein n=1 Tax=Pedobacter nyackensis TaxID=475255 RepID=UPI00292FBD39|nr:hypothetical protein [Pedobacter nyackensis]